MTKELFHSLLNIDFYKEHKDVVTEDLFSGVAKDLYRVLKWAYDKQGLAISPSTSELKVLYDKYYPAESTAKKHLVYLYLNELDSLSKFDLSVAKIALRQSLVNLEYDKAALLLIDQQNSKTNNLDKIREILTKAERLEHGEETSNTIDLDVQALLERTNKNCRWKFNIPALCSHLTGIGDGTLSIIAGRVNSGKTLACISFCFGPNGFAEQGARILYLCNEEDGAFTGIRAVSSFTGLSLAEIEADKEKAGRLFAPIRNNFIALDEPRMTMHHLEKAIVKYKPDIVVADQLDHVLIGGDYARDDLRLGQIYRQARELAKVYRCAFIGVSQTSAESDGKMYYGFNALANSKTDKPAACDLILLIGADAPNDRGEYSDIRAINVAKNKITGWHGAVNAVIKPNISRLVP